MKSPVVTASPGHKIKLSKIDPDDTGGVTKEKALRRFCDLREKIYELQEILYAEHRRSLLLVFQAMDTGGKDGAIKIFVPASKSGALKLHHRRNWITIFSGAYTRPRRERG